MKVSVIVPSRLQPNPVSHKGNLWLYRALESALGQTGMAPDVKLEIVVGLDADSREVDPGFIAWLKAQYDDPVVMVVHSPGRGQSAALNAAVKASTGDVLAFLEDDDLWHIHKLAVQLPLLKRYDIVTCNQREIDEQANFLRYNDFPTPSGWVMTRRTFDQVGWFDETFRFHVDTEWLGRAIIGGLKRCHVVEDGHAPTDFLGNVARFSDVVQSDDVTESLVSRLVNPAGGMGTIARDPMAAAQSIGEHDTMRIRFGGVPW